MAETLTSETRLVHREELGRLLDQWVEWLDPKRPNHLTTDMLADSLWSALAPSESPSPEGLDVARLTTALGHDDLKHRPSVFRAHSWGWYRNLAERIAANYADLGAKS